MKFIGGQEIGNYRVVRALGAGGMGEVYEVEHLRLGTHYALKAFTLSHGDVNLLKKRFMAEGKVLARLRHPNIARVHELDFDANSGVSYFVMDLVLSDDGSPRSLADVSPDTATEANLKKWFIQLCSALDYIHKKGIIHRDVKPANILIDEGGNAVLSDFGISRYANDDLRRQVGVTVASANGTSCDVTRQMILGTDAYMAPEVRTGREAVPASDAYSLGLVFFQLLTGVWFEPRKDVFDLLSSLDAMWTRVLPRLLDADASIRPAVLVAFVLGDQWKHRWVGRTSFFWVLAALQLLACFGVFALGVFYGHRLPPPNYDAKIKQLQKQCQQANKERDDYRRKVSELQDRVKITNQERDGAVLKANEARKASEDDSKRVLELQDKVKIANQEREIAELKANEARRASEEKASELQKEVANANKERDGFAKLAKKAQEDARKSEHRVREMQKEVYEAMRLAKLAQDNVDLLMGIVRELDKKGKYTVDLDSAKDKGGDPVQRTGASPLDVHGVPDLHRFMPDGIRGDRFRWFVPKD